MAEPRTIQFSQKFHRQMLAAKGLKISEGITARLAWYPWEAMMLPNGVGTDVFVAAVAHERYLSCMYYFQRKGEHFSIWGFKLHHFDAGDLNLMKGILGLS